MQIHGCGFSKDIFGSSSNAIEDSRILFLVNDGEFEEFEDWQTIEEIAADSHSIKEILAALAQYWKEYEAEEDFSLIKADAEREIVKAESQERKFWNLLMTMK